MNLKSLLKKSKTFFPGQINQKIFFLHVPKCGGTSLIEAIGSHYGMAEMISKKHFFALNPEAFMKASSILQEDTRIYRERLLLYYLSCPPMKYVSGHFKYSEKAIQNFGNEWRFITLLRDPVPRFFSYYFMDRYADFVPDFAKLNMSLESFLASERGKYHAVEYVMAFTEGIAIEEAGSAEAIEAAIANLNKFSLVGILERMDLFAADYQKLLGAELRLKKLNSSVLAKQKQQQLITDEIKQRVEEMCQPSMRIYEAIREKVYKRQ